MKGKNVSSGFRKSDQPNWIIGWLDKSFGKIPQVATTLDLSDRTDSWKMRWAIRRMHYSINPGLYAVGYPNENSPVLVTANYKMSFDRLRSQLSGQNAWLLVMDTKGINVWCAAGKGTFGTEELIRQINNTRIAEVVSHRKIILPQLGAPGVAAHIVKKETEFRVIYGPVRAADLPRFLDSGLIATPDMRLANFTFRERIVLVPVELVMALKPAVIILIVLLLISGIGKDVFSISRMMTHAAYTLALILSSLLLGAVVTPVLLPWIPGRPLALKGALVGVAGAVLLNQLSEISLFSPLGIGGFFLLITFSSFLAMNFTGATTYTSLSGVKKEMRFAVPAQVITLILGLGFLIGGYWL
jgi:hypothetical protein